MDVNRCTSHNPMTASQAMFSRIISCQRSGLSEIGHLCLQSSAPLATELETCYPVEPGKNMQKEQLIIKDWVVFAVWQTWKELIQLTWNPPRSLRILTFPPRPSGPTAIRLPLFGFEDADPGAVEPLHHLPMPFLAPSMPGTPGDWKSSDSKWSKVALLVS